MTSNNNINYEARKKVLKKSDKVRRAVKAALPDDLAYNWSHYIRTLAQTVGYFVIGLLCFYYQQKHFEQPLFTVNIGPVNLGWIVPYLYSPILALCLTGLFMFGHDGQHQVAGPRKTKLGKIVNKYSMWLTWDFLGCSTALLDPMHDYHHRYMNTQSDHEMVILDYGLGAFGELLHVTKVVLRWYAADLIMCLNIFQSKAKKMRITPVYRVWMALSLVFRIVLYGSLYCVVMKNGSNDSVTNSLNNSYNIEVVNWMGSDGALYSFNMILRPYITIFNLLCICWVFNHLLFEAHASPAALAGDEDQILYVLKNTQEWFATNSYWDQFQQFTHCSLSIHASHHTFPWVPRSLLYVVSAELKSAYPEHYREIDTLSGEFLAYWNRKVFHFASELYADQ